MKGLSAVVFLCCTWTFLSAPSCFNFQKGREGASFLASEDKAPPRQPLFKKYFPAPSGRNGMEDYLAALDRLIPSRAMDVAVWENYKRAPSDVDELDKGAMASLAKRFGDYGKTSILDARRKAIEGLSDIREIVRKGNSKPIESVHPNLNVDTLFPELAEFKTLVKYFVLESYVAFADGRSALGTDALLVALKMANRLPQENFISRLVTIAMNAIVLAEFEKHLDQLSINDIHAVQACLLEYKEWESGVSAALQGEMRFLEGTFKMMREQPAKGDMTGMAPEGAEKLFAAMKPGDWSAFVSSFEDTAKARMQAAKEILKASEVNWFKDLKQQGWLERDENLPEPKTLVEAGEQAGMLTTDLMPNIATAEAKYRTQQRLLRLHMRVLDYKWRMGKLPTRLEDTAPPEELQDTFGGGEFQFIPDTFGHYQLYSKGFRNTGRLDLRYRRDPNAAPGDQGDPPPK